MIRRSAVRHWMLATPVSLMLLMAVGCAREGQDAKGDAALEADAKLHVFVSIPPQKLFVERVGGDRVSVEVLVGAGQSPHTFTPMPKQLVRLSEADLYFRIGVPFEDSLIDKVSATMPDLEIVDTRAGIELQPMESACAHDDHDHHGQEGGLDPHIWLDPALVKQQVRNIEAALSKHDSEHAVEFQTNLTAFEGELDHLDLEIREALSHCKNRTFYVFHPAFGYFARAYDLKQVAVEQDGKAPTPKHLASLIERAKSEHVRLIFVQPEFPKESAQAVADAIGGAVVTVNPLAEDYVANMERIARQISEGLRDEDSRKAEELSTATAGGAQ